MSNNLAMAAGRRRARRAAVQALYQWQMTDQSVSDIDAQFRQEHAASKADMEYFSQLLFGVAKDLDELDAVMRDCVSRKLNEISPVEIAVLRLGAFEFKHCPDVPYRVVINEAVDLSKRFGADKAHKFINGVMDCMAKKLRSVEVNAASGSNKD